MEAVMIDRMSAPYGALVLRLALAAMWLAHASLKPVVFTMDGFAGFLASQGLPSFMAWPVFLIELVGGLAILAGFYGRYVSAALVPVMAVAMWTHLPNGWAFTNANGGWEYPAFLIAASIAHWLIGDGALAVKSARRAVPGGAERGVLAAGRA
jgi:putative oxidoreductase